MPANLPALTTEIEARDQRDRSRAASPLVPAADAIEIDSTTLTIDEVVDRILERARAVFGD
jgi:cytidylate kinase